MNIGTTIKKLRRGRDMTQEQLAEYLNVSVSAVSQWESDKTSPDLSVIPSICNLFSVTSDELLGIDLKNIKLKIREILNEAIKFKSRGYIDEAREILVNGLKEYPDSYILMGMLMHVYFAIGRDTKYTDKEKTADKNEIIKLGNKILDRCTEDSIRHSAIQLLCYTYSDLGEIDKAVSLANTMPDISVSSTLLLSHIGRGNFKYKNIQNELFYFLQFFANDLEKLNIQLDSSEYAYTAEEMAIIRDKQIEIFNVIFENKDFGFFNSELSTTHAKQMEYYANQKDSIKLLQHLGLAAYHAIEFIKYNGTVEHTSLIYRGYGKNIGYSTTDSNNDAARLLEQLNDTIYDFVRSEPEFIQIEENLKQYAGIWPVE